MGALHCQCERTKGITNLLAYIIFHLVRCVNARTGNGWMASSSIESHLGVHMDI